MRPAAALAPLVVLAAAFVVWCVVDVLRHPVKVLPRWAWLLVILLSIPLGGILFLLLGRGERAPRAGGGGGERGGGGDEGAGGGDEGDGGGDEGDGGDGVRQGGARPAASVRPTGAPAVQIAGVGKLYGAHAALDDVSLTVPQGSVFGMVGPNGAGKTTLLAILAGLRQPTSGHVELAMPRHKIALLPDTPHFEPWLTAREVVDLARALTRPQSSSAVTADALERAGLADAADRRTGGFSRGMLQRLGLAAAMVGAPDLLLLDEPCSALDPAGRRDVLDLVGGLGGSHTVLFCSHILDDVQEVCDTVGVLREGRVLFQGPLDDLLVGRAAPAYAVRVRGPAQPVLVALGREPWVQSVEQVGAEQLEVLATSVDEAERNLVPALARAEARVVSIVPSGSDLERVFLELVR